jgi:hypothetical protein
MEERKMNHRIPAVLVAALGLVVLVGCLLPWATLNAPADVARYFRSTTKDAFSRSFDGTIILIASLLAAVGAGLAFFGVGARLPLGNRGLLLAAGALLAVAAVLTILALLGKTFDLRDLGHAGSMRWTRGIGILVTVLATLGGGAIALFAAVRGPVPAR